MDFAGFPIVDAGGLTDEDAHGDHGAFLDDDPFDDLGAGPDEAVVFDDGRVGLQRLENPADTDATGEMNIGADLGTGTHGHPGVDHGAFPDIAADVDIGGHQNGVAGDVGALADDGIRYDANGLFLETLRGVVGKLEWHLVVEVGARGSQHGIFVDAKIEQHGLLQPLMYHPLTGDFLGNTGLTRVQHLDGLQNRLARQSIHAGRRDAVTAFIGLFNQAL